MPVFSSTLQSQASTQANKTAYSNKIKELLGSTRRVRCFHTSNASADPYATGTEFLNVQLTGDIEVSVGNITSFGVLSAATINQAVNLSTGAAVMRIEGGGHSISFTMGLTGSGKEFTIPSNPTGSASSGFAFTVGSGMKAPIFLPSGTGPAAPEIDADMVTAFRLVDWRDPAAPVAVGTAPFSQREPDLVSERPFVAREMGDVRQMRTPDGSGIVFGTGGECFKFAGTSYLMNASANSEANVPLQQVEIRAAPHGRWDKYPFKLNLDTAEDTLIPWPFKIELLKADGTIKDVIEMYSSRVNNVPGTGKAINSATQSINPWAAPCQPFWTCMQGLPWMSHKPKPNTMAQHLMPAVEAEAMSPLNIGEQASSQEAWPAITGTGTYNGWNVWRVAPKWSRQIGTGFDTTIIDSGLPSASKDDYVSQAFGYGWEPGANGLHVMYMAPGGTRHDRSYKPSSVVAYLTAPTGNRIHGAVPYREMAHQWIMSYFSHGCHYFTDVEKGLSIAKGRVLNNTVCYNDVYYGSNENYLPDINNNAVRLMSAFAGNQVGVLDKNGRRMNNEYSRDYQHNQSNGALGAYMFNSPMHLIEARHFFTANVLSTSWMLGTSFTPNDFMTRQHAWYEGQFLDAWLGATSDPRGFNSAEIENMWQKHLEAVHDLMMPIYQNDTSIYGVTLRNLGIGSDLVAGPTGMTGIKLITDSKAAYFGQILMMMKQSGAWALMRGKSAKCTAILDLIVLCCHKLTVDFFMDCNGRFDQRPANLNYPNGSPIVPTDWGVYSPPNNGVDWVRVEGGDFKVKGSKGSIDTTNTMHFRAQMLLILKRVFPEYAYPRHDAAITKVRQFYADTLANKQAGGDYFNYRYPMMGIFDAPDYIGPPV